ncbi:MAG: alpha-glucan family phosphorylase [Candidatus Hodarchaeales archaeon]
MSSEQLPIDLSRIPSRISGLKDLAYNLWSYWNHDAINLWKELDDVLWLNSEHNPVSLLQKISDKQLLFRSKDPDFLKKYDFVINLYNSSVLTNNGSLWFNKQNFNSKDSIAYFSFEYGLHQSLPIYSGGLGILSGDYMKEASDLGVPLIAVGFMYPYGYFKQKIPSHGWQEAEYELLNFSTSPIFPVLDQDNKPLIFPIKIDKNTIYIRLWKIKVGNALIYLMDTNIEENTPWDRELSARLYSGDQEMRLRQEIVLGIGGIKILRKLGIQPKLYHMNEGHSAFLTLELLREEMEQGKSFDKAIESVKQKCVFTTHTPVPAGHDVFSYPLINQYFSEFRNELGISTEDFLDLASVDQEWGKSFNMTVLALRLSRLANGVSKLNGEIANKMWKDLWIKKNINETPIIGITNGVHSESWVSPSMWEIYKNHLGFNGEKISDKEELWRKIKDIPDETIWNAHHKAKTRLFYYIRDRVRKARIKKNLDAEQIISSGTLLDPEALTIGFARRFATYKRANLIFRDVERLKNMLSDPYKPIQFIFAGKAHPDDDLGKNMLQFVYNMTKKIDFESRIAFIEDYDIIVSKYLISGVDVWLNTPLKPHEASGTSGMKAAMNGVLNLSVLDGWWQEGYNYKNGWSIGNGESLDDKDEQDKLDADYLYQTLEEQVIPLYYQRDSDGIPRPWVKLMKESISTVTPKFSTQRMIKDYISKLYYNDM